jgi:hypothetical protein
MSFPFCTFEQIKYVLTKLNLVSHYGMSCVTDDYGYVLNIFVRSRPFKKEDTLKSMG